MSDTVLYYDEIASPIGPLTVLSDGAAVLRMDYGTMDDLETVYKKWAGRYFTEPIFEKKPDRIPHLAGEVTEYFQSNQQIFSIPLKLYGTPFQKSVWQALIDYIPYGETRTYKDIASAIGNEKAVRAVGGAVNKNPVSIIVPCHRVIGSNGKMVGYNGGIDKKEHLLELERTIG